MIGMSGKIENKCLKKKHDAMPQSLKDNSDEYWRIIELVDWKSDGDYKRINAMFSVIPKQARKNLYSFIEKKHHALKKCFESDAISGEFNVSDDGYDDLTAEVVGRGKDFYNSITAKKLRRMGNNREYTENFTYSTQDD